MSPDCWCQCDGKKLFPLDAPLQLGWGPVAIKPLALAVGAKADDPRAVSKELE